MTEYVVTITVCKHGSCDRLYTSAVMSKKRAEEKWKRLMTGAENYGQFLFDPHSEGVMLSMWKDGQKCRTMQLN